MKRFLLAASALIFSITVINAQTSVNNNNRLRDMAGKQVIASTFDNNGKPYIVCFWSRNTPGSDEFMNVVAPLYKNWQAETGVKIITVALDEAENSTKVFSYLQSKGWNFENYVDENGEYKKLMNVYDLPHIFIFNGKKEVVLQLHSFQPGDEIAILNALKNQ